MKNIEKVKERYSKQKNKKISQGYKKGLIHTYPDALFDRLRPYSVGGFPASIMLFVIELCNGKCYDRAMLMQLALENCRVVHGDIEELRIMAGEEYAEHAFVETKDFGENKTYVIDTSIGLIFEKNYYYKMQKVKVNKVFSKEKCMENPDIKDILASNFEQDKYTLTITLPLIEQAIKNSNYLGTVLYREKILRELEIFKTSINYDGIRKEVDEDIKMMYEDPKKLDEKFGIVRDKYGREISRNGVANPYYVSPEEIDEMEMKYEEAKKDEVKFQQYLNEMAKQAIEDIKLEYAKTDEIAKKRLEEILKNPTANFYETNKSNNR